MIKLHSANQWGAPVGIDDAHRLVAPARSTIALSKVARNMVDRIPQTQQRQMVGLYRPRFSFDSNDYARRIIQLLLLLLIVISPLTAWSQYSSVDAMVTRSIRNRDVLRVQTTVDSAPSGNSGFVKISVTAPKPSPADRDLVVVFYLENFRGSNNSNVAYRVPLRLEEGKSRVETEIPFITGDIQSVWDVGIFEDGRDIEDKRTQNSGSQWINRAQQLGAIGALIASDESEKYISEELKVLQYERLSVVPNQPTANLPITATVTPVSQASEDWRFYLTRTVWFLSSTAVAELNQRPRAAEALRTYVASGGTLVVTTATDEARMLEVDKLLAGQSSATDTQCWTDDFTVEGGNVIVNSGYLKSPGIIPQSRPFFRRHCFGNVLVTVDPLKDMKTDYWQTTISSMLNHTLLSSESDGDWFWRNLIRAVGKPPVWVFCGMVALFGAMLGPGLLVFTGRMQRRSLMIFLVPAISLLATGAIVSYGVLHEGFDTYVRVTSVQAFEPSVKQGFVWSRQNYFCGLPPREGIHFSPQTYAREVAAEHNESNYRWDGDPRRGITSTVNILPEHQTWTGWVRPRQQQQLIVGHSVTSPKLPMEVTRTEGKTIVKNLSSTELAVVLFRGERLDYYFAQDVAPGQSVEARPDSVDVVRAKVAKAMVDYRPQSPPELGEGGSLLDFGSGARRYTTQNSFYELEDILNAYFKRQLSDKLELPPFGFAVLTTESDQVEVPLKGRSEENLHLIMGRQAW